MREIEGAEAFRAATGTPVATWDPRAHEVDRTAVLDAHRHALGGSTVTILANWHGRRRVLAVAPIRSGDRIVGTAGVAVDAVAADAADVVPVRTTQHDPVTDLPSRGIFEQRVEAAIADAAASGRRCAVLFVDIDRFKTVNDLGGHAAGDAVLRALAYRLHRTIGEHDALARFSADEFVVLCVGLANQGAKGVAADILAAFEAPFVYAEHEFRLTGSIGISYAPDDADDAAALVAHAETAMFEAKRLGRNVVRRYVPAVLATPSERHALQRELLHAIERDQLEVLYQPVFSIDGSAVLSFEALVRWRHHSLGLVSPNRFIPMAEETGLIDRIGEWVLVRACEQLGAWHAAGYLAARVSVNVSARQLERMALHRVIRQTVERVGIPPASLEIEVTETSILRDVYAATLLLREIRAIGLRVAIDDFGAGFTSLAFLRDMPVDDIKIDRTFVRDITSGRFDSAVVRAVVSLAHNIGVRTIAEGVETREQLDVLRELRCDAVQGFLFSEPLAPEACPSLLAKEPA